MPFSFLSMSVCIMGLLFVTACIPVVIFDYYHDLLERRLLRSARRRGSRMRGSVMLCCSLPRRAFSGHRRNNILYYILLSGSI